MSSINRSIDQYLNNLILSTECLPGYIGPECSYLCTYPHFGDECRQICKCPEELCDFVNGCKTISSESTCKHLKSIQYKIYDDVSKNPFIKVETDSN